MYSIAATGKWPLPIAGSRQLTASTARIFCASLCLPATAASRSGRIYRILAHFIINRTNAYHVVAKHIY